MCACGPVVRYPNKNQSIGEGSGDNVQEPVFHNFFLVLLSVKPFVRMSHFDSAYFEELDKYELETLHPFSTPTKPPVRGEPPPGAPKKNPPRARVTENLKPVTEKLLYAATEPYEVFFRQGKYHLNTSGQRRLDYDISPYLIHAEAILYKNSGITDAFVYPLDYDRLTHSQPTSDVLYKPPERILSSKPSSTHGLELLKRWERNRRHASFHVKQVVNGGARWGGVRFFEEPPQSFPTETIQLHRSYRLDRAERKVFVYHWIDSSDVADMWQKSRMKGVRYTERWLDCHTNPFWVWAGAARANDVPVRLEILLSTGTEVAITNRYDPHLNILLRDLESAGLQTVPELSHRDYELRLPPGKFKVIDKTTTGYFHGNRQKTCIVFVKYEPLPMQ